MYGVVLWSSKEDSKAVIWCEDHGDLAFYSAASDSSAFDGCSLDAGDLVSFSVSEGHEMRMAIEPELIAEQQYPGLAESLMADIARVRSDHGSQTAAPARGAGHAPNGNVVAFAPAGRKTRMAS